MNPDVRLIHGDCLAVLPTLEAGSVDAIVTDPPYGVNQDSDNTRFPSLRGGNKTYGQIEGDDHPFNPTPFLNFPRVAIFGANCFSDRLPLGSWLIWCKRRDSMFGKFLADAEAIWINRGFGLYVLQHEWHGALKESERGKSRYHPHQKPVAVMQWVIERLGVPAGATVLDPYMGSGSTGIACIKSGRSFIGIEKDPRYFAIAARRLKAAETPLFAAIDGVGDDRP
jgi:site-specific DNA-methyltransferase (adenine-specific)